MPRTQNLDLRSPAAIAISCLMFATLGSIGCGGPVGELKGKITRAATPLFPSQITLTPTDAEEDQTVFSGATTPSGDFNIDYYGKGGAPAGAYKVQITWHEDRKGNLIGGDEQGMALIDDGKAVAKACEFDIEIANGENAKDFDVSQGKAVVLVED